MWDYDQYGSNDYIGLFFHNFSDEEKKLADELYHNPDLLLQPPAPKWYQLMQEEEGDSTGEVLASFQLIRKPPGGKIPDPPTIVPKFREACLEILCIGVRDMAPFQFLPMQFPKLEFSVEYAGY